jgi:hypothetical protein
MVQVNESPRLVFESPTWNKKRMKRAYFDGTLEYCSRAGCDWEVLHPRGCDLQKCERKGLRCSFGEPKAYKRTVLDLASGEETEASNESTA